MVIGVVSDRHAGARRATRVRTDAIIERGDVITPANGASARIAFTKKAKAMEGTMFTLAAPAAATQQIQPGAAKPGPRLAFAHDGRDIATVVGPGLDVATKISAVKPAGTRAARIAFSAPSDKGSAFACRVDHGAFTACRSPETLHLHPGKHTFAVRSTSLYGFHGIAVSRSFRVGR